LQPCNLTTSQDPGELLWLFSSIVDVVKAGHCDRGSFNLRALKPHVGNKKGIVDLFLFKKGDAGLHCQYLHGHPAGHPRGGEGLHP